MLNGVRRDVARPSMAKTWPFRHRRYPSKQRPAEQFIRQATSSLRFEFQKGKIVNVGSRPVDARADSTRPAKIDGHAMSVLANEELSVWAFNLHGDSASFASFEAQDRTTARWHAWNCLFHITVNCLIRSVTNYARAEWKIAPRMLEAKSISVK